MTTAPATHVMVALELCGSLKLSFGLGNAAAGTPPFSSNTGACTIEGTRTPRNLRITIWVGNLLVIRVLKCTSLNKPRGLQSRSRHLQTGVRFRGGRRMCAKFVDAYWDRWRSRRLRRQRSSSRQRPYISASSC